VEAMKARYDTWNEMLEGNTAGNQQFHSLHTCKTHPAFMGGRVGLSMLDMVVAALKSDVREVEDLVNQMDKGVQAIISDRARFPHINDVCLSPSPTTVDAVMG
jgi:hypothetical protein